MSKYNLNIIMIHLLMIVPYWLTIKLVLHNGVDAFGRIYQGATNDDNLDDE
jgi:hypothetical protein